MRKASKAQIELIINLRLYEELTIKEIESRTGFSSSTIKKYTNGLEEKWVKEFTRQWDMIYPGREERIRRKERMLHGEVGATYY